MFLDIFFLLLDTACGFFSFALLARFSLQWARASFRNPLGQFIFAVTDWMLRPARRVIPAIGGLDTASLVLAWLWQALYLGLFFGLTRILGAVSLNAVLVVALLAAVEVVKIGLYVAMGAVIVSAVFSWVNPYAPMAGIFNSLTRPLLRPFQRLIPPVGGVDLSPLALLLLLQVGLMVLNHLRVGLIPFLHA